MSDPAFWAPARISGAILVLGFLAFLPAGLMFAFRGGMAGRPLPSQAYFVVERSLVMAAVVLTAVGLVLLEEALRESAGHVLARTGATTYLFGAILVVAAEALSLNGGFEKYFPLIAIYVVLAFLSQIATGGALLQAGVLAAWLGWLMIGWNIALLVWLPLFHRRDIYYPWVHHFMPLVIGIALLWPGR